MEALVANRLTKIYSQGKKAVDSMSFSIGKGEVFGFLGPNGAGKTTAVKLFNGMLSPTEGESRVFGIDPGAAPEKLHSISGVVTEHARMYGNMTGMQNLVFFGNLFGLGASESENRAENLLERLSLMDARDRKLSAYSTGMRQRLSLARAMMHRPQILFLDEPTSGLDPESAQGVNNMIKSLARDDGTTIFLCTHQLRYAQEICTTYGLIDEGSLLASGNMQQLRARVFDGMNVLIKADSVPAEIGCTQLGTGKYSIQVQSKDEIPHIVRRIVESGGNIYSVSADRMSLEEIYFALLDRKAGGK